jgi:hypothetical protein
MVIIVVKGIEISDNLMSRFRKAVVKENDGTYTRGDQKKKAEQIITEYCQKIENDVKSVE